jgi:hypothetical protein
VAGLTGGVALGSVFIWLAVVIVFGLRRLPAPGRA